MEDNSIWIISILTLVTGGVIGYFAGRSGTSVTKQQDLTLQLEESQRQLNDYKQQVNEHFERTAELVNNMTESYKAVHQHLASSSEVLCDADTSKLAAPGEAKPAIEDQRPAAATATESTATVAETVETATAEPVSSEPENIPEPPRDYAPKNPDEEGTLSETFGVKKAAPSEEPEPAPADHFPEKKAEAEAKA